MNKKIIIYLALMIVTFSLLVNPGISDSDPNTVNPSFILVSSTTSGDFSRYVCLKGIDEYFYRDQTTGTTTNAIELSVTINQGWIGGASLKRYAPKKISYCLYSRAYSSSDPNQNPVAAVDVVSGCSGVSGGSLVQIRATSTTGVTSPYVQFSSSRTEIVEVSDYTSIIWELDTHFESTTHYDGFGLWI